MENIYMVGTNHQNVIENRRVVDIVMDVISPNQIYIEDGGDESDIEVSISERMKKLDLSKEEKIASLFDCYAMRNLKNSTPKFSEFSYAEEKAEEDSIPVVKIDKSKEELVREVLKETDKKELVKYSCAQFKNLITRNNIESILYNYAIGRSSKPNNREQKMLNEIKNAERKENTVVFTGFYHIDYLKGELEDSNDFNCKVIWRVDERGTKEELREYILSKMS